MKQNHERIQRKQSRDGDKDTSKAKALLPTIVYYLQALKQFYLSRLGATSFTQKQEKGHPHRRERQTGSVDLYGVEPGGPSGPHETDAGYLHPRGATMGRSRRLFPTTARTAAPDCGLAAFWRFSGSLST